MRYIFFDLGDTLETNDVLRPGARQTLLDVAALRDDRGQLPKLGLISDFHQAATPADVPGIEAEYRQLLVDLTLEEFFRPFEQAVTLSTHVGVFKPDRRIFRRALDKFDPEAHFHDAIFVTETKAHVLAARELGLHALHIRPPNQGGGDVPDLPSLVPHIKRLLRFSPCCKKSGEAVGRVASVASKRRAVDPEVAARVAEVQPDRLRASITGLAEFPTRSSHAPGIVAVSQHLRDRFVGLGYSGASQVRFQNFSIPGAGPQRNVLCGPPAFARPLILVGAHYDSTSEKASTLAPGADDNASGVAVLLELAALLRGVPLTRDILFAAFGGEEQGLFGSARCADVAAAERWPIELVMNLDMVGFPNGQPANRIVVEYDHGNGNPQNDPASKAFGELMAQAAADYTSLAVEHTNIWNSDYMPFEAEGFACIGAFEGGDNPFYHRTTDVAAQVDVPYVADVTRMVLATILTIAR